MPSEPNIAAIARKPRPMRTARRVRDRRADVRCPSTPAGTASRSLAVSLAVERVDRVAGPRPIGAFEDPEVDAASSRRRTSRSRRPDGSTRSRIEQARRRRASVDAHPARPADVGRDEIAVHVPLDVGDVVIAQARRRALEQVLADLAVGRDRARAGCEPRTAG